MIAVVIPYFQRQPGILTRCLRSIAAQTHCSGRIHVVVVDDGSPVPAAGEVALAAALSPPNIEYHVIVRPNGGPGAARNTGLDAVPEGTRDVAFLDSDDEWTPEHLSRAVATLDLGFDFYFSDFYQLEQTVGAFERAGRLRPRDHAVVPGGPADVHAYRGDMFDQILRGNVIGTPTVVYRWDRFCHERFRADFTRAGEDYLFWMQFATQGARIAFSSRPEAVCGRGVNVYSGAGWGTEGHLARLHDEVRFRRAVARWFDLNPVQRDHVRRDLARLRLAFARDLFHRWRHLRSVSPRLLLRHLRADPLTLLRLPYSLLQVLAGRYAPGRPSPTGHATAAPGNDMSALDTTTAPIALASLPPSRREAPSASPRSTASAHETMPTKAFEAPDRRIADRFHPANVPQPGGQAAADAARPDEMADADVK